MDAMNPEEDALNDAEGELPTDPPENEDYDDTPAFVGADDAVEVEINDDDVPMDDDDDDDDDEDNDLEEADNDIANVTDMSNFTIQSHANHAIYAVAAHYYDESSQKLIVVSGGGDDKSYLHSVDSSGTVSSMLLPHAHTDSVSCVALNLPYLSDDWTKTPPLAAVGAYDGAILLYNPLNGGEKVLQLEGPTDVECLAFHPKGGTVLLAGSAADGTVWMYHLPLNKCLQVFVGHERAVTAVDFTPDGRWAVTASSDGTVRIWAPKSGKSKHVFRLEAPLTSMAMGGGEDGMLVIVGAEDGQAHICHAGTLKVVCSLRHFEIPKDVDECAELPTSVETVAFSPGNSNWCATGGVDGVLKVWDLANDGQCRHVCRPEGITGGITRLQWHPSLALVFSSYTDGAVRLWDARNGQLLKTLTGSTEVLNDLCVQFTNGGKSSIVMTASDDGNLRVFHVDVASLLE